MNKKIINLNELPLNNKGYIEKIECNRKHKEKIIRFGVGKRCYNRTSFN